MESQQSRVRDYLLRGGRLTVQKAQQKFNTTELRTIVSRLRRDTEHPIEILSHRVTMLTSGGRRVVVKEYYCPDVRRGWWMRVVEGLDRIGVSI